MGSLWSKNVHPKLSQEKRIHLPSFILHAYKMIKPGDLLVVANTLFDTQDKRTHDTDSEEDFRTLQQYIMEA